MSCERAVSSSTRVSFKPPSADATSYVIEASSTAKPGEIVSTSDKSATVSRNKSWEAHSYKAIGVEECKYQLLRWGFEFKMNHNSGHGSGVSGSSYGGGGGLYGGGMYSNNRYRGGTSRIYGSSGMYGGGMASGGTGGSTGGYGPGGGPHGPQDPNNRNRGCPHECQDPNNPNGGNPQSRPKFWISFQLRMQRVVRFFRRLSILFDQNARAFHLFMTGLVQVFDRSSVLYGELARFVLRLLGMAKED
ncbi:hypothetical protein RIF29_25340 [Crotalaria pallida]|uniref:Uncharacterized protein n=1 Tax=Crotalaria pallida TaxID=3830 RepID=A0AAN9ELE6_CROPI